MKIAMILASLANTGPQIVAKDLCEGLIQSGHDCHVFYFDDIVELNMPCETTRINFKEPINFNDYDIIHTHMFRPDAYVRYHNKKIMKPKIISTLHNPIDYNGFKKDYNFFKALFIGSTWSQLLKKHDRIVTLNPVNHSKLKSSLRKKSEIIYNGRTSKSDGVIDRADKNLLEDLKKEYKLLITVSGINKRKGLHQIIRALPLLEDYCLVIIGQGEEQENLKTLAKELNVESRCFFLGFKPDPVPYLKIADIFIMTSYSEGFPLALIEAASQKKPAVISDIAILKSLFPEDTVVYYKLDDIKDLADKIKKAYDKKEFYSNNLYDFYVNNLTKEIMVSNYCSLYNKILNHK